MTTKRRMGPISSFSHPKARRNWMDYLVNSAFRSLQDGSDPSSWSVHLQRPQSILTLSQHPLEATLYSCRDFGPAVVDGKHVRRIQHELIFAENVRV